MGAVGWAAARDPRQGHRWNDHRMVIDGVLFRTRTGCPGGTCRRGPAAGGAAARPAYDPGCYKQRNTVERCFSKLKQFRAVATRYDKRERIYQGTIDVASISIWLRDPVP